MKKKDKKFLKYSDPHEYNQLCYSHEKKSAIRLMKKGYIKKIDTKDSCLRNGQFLMWLTKKGIKRVKKYGD
jgi:hypothetical protein